MDARPAAEGVDLRLARKGRPTKVVVDRLVHVVERRDPRKICDHRIEVSQHGAVVDNPVNVPWDVAVDWPEDSGRWRLACLARFQFSTKGQDLILNVLSRPAWRDRPVTVTFVGGDDGDEQRLRELIDHYRLTDRARVGDVARRRLCAAPPEAWRTPFNGDAD
jgi:hypothetical protein